MVQQFNDENLGISFEHLSSWKQQPGQPGVPEIAFITGEQIVVVFLGVPLSPTATPDQVINEMLQNPARENESLVKVSSGETEKQANSFTTKLGNEELQFIHFQHNKMLYLLQIQLKKSNRFPKDLQNMLDSVTFTKPALLRQPVTSVNCKTFYSADEHVKINYPSDWSPSSTFSNPETIAKFSIVEEEDFSLSLTISKQSLPLSVTTPEYCTLVQNHICKSGLKYSEQKRTVSDQETICFSTENAKGTKVMYTPIAVEGRGYLLICKSKNADFLHPKNLFDVLVSSFSLQESITEEELASFRYFNFSPYITFSISKEFTLAGDPMGATQFTYTKNPLCSFTVFPVDMTQIRQMAPHVQMSSIYDFMRLQWDAAQLPYQIQSESKVKIGKREVSQVVTRGIFLPQTETTVQITFFNSNNISVGLIWQAPSTNFMQFWKDEGAAIYRTLSV